MHETLDPESAGARAAKAIRKHTDQTHVAALALVDELLALGSTEDATTAALPIVESCEPVS